MKGAASSVACAPHRGWVYHARVTAADLDNPIWESLRTRHRALAIGAGNVLRYPPEVAPFLGVADADADASVALDSLLKPGDTALLLGVAPRVDGAFQLTHLETIAQMVCDAPPIVPNGPKIVVLGDAQRDDVLALIHLVYPHYFRPRTLELGRYFGIYQGAQLAAMIGERMATTSHTEMSGICTHPAFAGRGYASRLTAFLTRDTLAHARTPFLHVSQANPHAANLYARLGYRVRAELPFWSLRRV